MSTYTPDVWVVIKINSLEHGEIYKILAGWYGGYLNGDSWKMNSGIVKVFDEGDYWDVYGDSGSIYKCYKTSEKLSGYTAQIFEYYATRIAEKGPEYSLVQVDAADSFKQFIK